MDRCAGEWDPPNFPKQIPRCAASVRPRAGGVTGSARSVRHAARGTGTRSAGESVLRSLSLVSGPHHNENAAISDNRMT